MYIDTLDILSAVSAEILLLLIALNTISDTRKYMRIAAVVVSAYVILATIIYSLAAPNLDWTLSQLYWSIVG